jgi:hypothetical protein
MPEDLAKTLKAHPGRSYPAVLLAQLGVDASAQGKRLGYALMKVAFQKSWEIAQAQGAVCLLTDPIDPNAERFYREKFNFVPLVSGRLVLLMRTIEKSLEIERQRDDEETIGELRTELENARDKASVLLDLTEKLNQNDALSKQGARQMLQALDTIERAVTDLRAFKAQRDLRGTEEDDGPPPQ